MCSVGGQSKVQTADYCFQHANEYVTVVVPLFPLKTMVRSQSVVCILHCPVYLWKKAQFG